MKRQKVKHGTARIAGYTEESEFAAELGLSPITAAKKRKRGESAAWVRIGRKIYYSDQAKFAWLRSLEAEAQAKMKNPTTRRLRQSHASV